MQDANLNNLLLLVLKDCAENYYRNYWGTIMSKIGKTLISAIKDAKKRGGVSYLTSITKHTRIALKP